MKRPAPSHNFDHTVSNSTQTYARSATASTASVTAHTGTYCLGWVGIEAPQHPCPNLPAVRFRIDVAA